MCKELTQDLLHELFDYRDDGNLIRKVQTAQCVRIGDVAGHKQKNGYSTVRVNNKPYYLHRLIFLYHHGYLPQEIDHVDGNPENNRTDNLRFSTHSQNLGNSRHITSVNGQPTASRYKGVTWDKTYQKWRAQITVKYKHINIGSFTDEQDAAKAYNDMALKHRGEYAKLNMIEDD